MPVTLVSEDYSWSIELPLAEGLVDALACQIGRLDSGTSRDAFQRRLAEHLPPALFEVLDSDLKPPTESQLKFADDISRKLGIEIPGHVFQSRARMQAFISRHLAELQRRAKGSK